MQPVNRRMARPGPHSENSQNLCSTSSHHTWWTCFFLRRTSRLEQFTCGYPCRTRHYAFQEHS